MFKENKYTRLYISIIERARTRIIDDYTESHHVIPKCLGGSNLKDNIVRLTAREHFLCHLLLTKMNDNHLLKFAVYMMSVANPNQIGKRYKIKSRIYSISKRLMSEAASIRSMGNTNNLGKKGYYNPITNEQSNFIEEKVPLGWLPGRSPDFKARNKGMNGSNIYYSNPSTGDCIHIAPGSAPPNGYIKFSLSASKGGLSAPKINCYHLETGEFTKVYSIEDIPMGYTEGSPSIWITDGTISKQINRIKGLVPSGWVIGRTISTNSAKNISKARERPIETPLGDYTHPLRMSEKYGCDIYAIMDNLDTKIRIRKSNEKLRLALAEVGYDFGKTKRDNGFRYKGKS